MQNTCDTRYGKVRCCDVPTLSARAISNTPRIPQQVRLLLRVTDVVYQCIAVSYRCGYTPLENVNSGGTPNLTADRAIFIIIIIITIFIIIVVIVIYSDAYTRHFFPTRFPLEVPKGFT